MNIYVGTVQGHSKQKYVGIISRTMSCESEINSVFRSDPEIDLIDAKQFE